MDTETCIGGRGCEETRREDVYPQNNEQDLE